MREDSIREEARSVGETKSAASLPGQRILVIDDESVVALSCQRVLRPEGHQVEVCTDPRQGLESARSGLFDIILLDLLMPGLDGMEILRELKSQGVEAEVIIITGHATVDTAVEAMKLGAADYLTKPFTPDQLRIAVRKVAERMLLARENVALRRELGLAAGLEGILGESRAMQQVFALIRRVAPTDGTVLITGESGTGKEMIARAIHRLSRRKDQPLLACDCTALAPTLLESELFGHVKGSFSGAIATKQGLFEVAHRGTLFLDEVGNLTMEIQSKLLRVLETRRVRKVGDTQEHEVDIRLIAATNRNLAEMVQENRFREDLYYRLNVVPVFVPPLRERHGDIPLLAATFLERICQKNDLRPKRFSPEAMALLENYPWPGNVRELKNVVERMAILWETDVIEPHHLPPEIRQAPARPTPSSVPSSWEELKRIKQQLKDAAVQDLERRFLIQALERCRGNVTRAAEMVGLQRTNFHKLMRKHGLTSEQFGGSSTGEAVDNS